MQQSQLDFFKSVGLEMFYFGFFFRGNLSSESTDRLNSWIQEIFQPGDSASLSPERIPVANEINLRKFAPEKLMGLEYDGFFLGD